MLYPTPPLTCPVTRTLPRVHAYVPALNEQIQVLPFSREMFPNVVKNTLCFMDATSMWDNCSMLSFVYIQSYGYTPADAPRKSETNTYMTNMPAKLDTCLPPKPRIAMPTRLSQRLISVNNPPRWPCPPSEVQGRRLKEIRNSHSLEP